SSSSMQRCTLCKLETRTLKTRTLRIEERTIAMPSPVSKLKAQLANFKWTSGDVRTGLSMVLLLASLALVGCGGAKASGPPAKPPEVDVMEVVQKDVPIVSEWTATLDGYVHAQIQHRVSGYLTKQNYKEGSYVQKGQVLFEIYERPFVAALNEAKGQLAQAQAAMGKAQQDVKRDK